MGKQLSRRVLLLQSISACGVLCYPSLSQAQDNLPADQPAHFDCLTPQITEFDRIQPSITRPIPFAVGSGGRLEVIPLAAGTPKGIVRYDDYATISAGDAWRRSDSLDPGQPTILLGVHFLDGSELQRSLVREHAPKWTGPQRANVRLVFDLPRDEAQIRIRFETNVNNSYIGRQATYARTEETMNLADVTSNDDVSRRVTLHEFGHALGLRHEHQHPDLGIPWNRSKVYAHYKERYGWEITAVDRNIFQTYSRSFICHGFEGPDFRSIMMYDIRPELTDGRFAVTAANDLSSTDIGCISRIYPA